MPPETGQAVTGKERHICLQTDRLQSNIARLGEVIVNVFDTLKPALGPEYPAPKTPEAPREETAISPMADILKNANTTLEGDIERLVELVHRIEV